LIPGKGLFLGARGLLLVLAEGGCQRLLMAVLLASQWVLKRKQLIAG